MTIEEAAAKLRRREVSAVELARESLEAIRKFEPILNAFITVTGDLALEQARRADDELARGIDRGPLHGIPYALKDLFETSGIRTTAGSKIFADYVPDHDSVVYRKLTEAGAVLIGKTGMHELAYGITNDNPHYGPVRNPRDPARISGGSSGGSAAAVASGSVFFAMGTDTGGSIRIPAAFCGCVGFKPTFGLVDRTGVIPLSSSMDHVGPITRTVRDAELVMEAISDFESTPARPACRIGVPANFFTDNLSPAVAAAFNRIGARLTRITVPDPVALNTVARIILLSEASAFAEPHLNRRADFGADVLALLDQGRLVPATDYINAQRLRRIYQTQWAQVWEGTDFIISPTVAIEAPLLGQTTVDGEDVRLASTRLVRPFNALGWPAISIPISDGSSLPVGLQIVAKPSGDADLLAFASSFPPTM